MADVNKITTIEQLKEYALGQIVELPPFAEGQQFFARLKRPSMFSLVKRGIFTNELLTKAQELFFQDENTFDAGNSDTMSKMLGVLETLADETFVEPKYKEIKEAGIELTDEQLTFVFNYTQKGVQALESFRPESKDREHIDNVEAV